MHLYSHVEDSTFKTSLDEGDDGDFLISPWVLTAGQGEITSDTSRFPDAQGGIPPLSYNNCGTLNMDDPYELHFDTTSSVL